MFELSEKTRDLIGFGALLVFLMLLLLLPYQLPKEIDGDFPADAYPRALFTAGVVLLLVQIGSLLLKGKGKVLCLRSEGLVRAASLFAVMAGGYLLILASGFLLAGAFFVFCYAWILKERDRAALMVAVATPAVVYWVLEVAFQIRLPSILDVF